MLVLKRSIGQEVVIEGGIAVRVVAIEGGAVKLGFEAPSDVGIRRAELLYKQLEEPAAVESLAQDSPEPSPRSIDVRGRVARAFARRS